MARKLKMFTALLFAGNRVTRPGRSNCNTQVTAVVMATSKSAAAEAFGMSLYEFNTYCHAAVSESWKHYSEAKALLDTVEPGRVAIHPMDNGDLVDGQKGWVLK